MIINFFAFSDRLDMNFALDEANEVDWTFHLKKNDFFLFFVKANKS